MQSRKKAVRLLELKLKFSQRDKEIVGAKSEMWMYYFRFLYFKRNNKCYLAKCTNFSDSCNQICTIETPLVLTIKDKNEPCCGNVSAIYYVFQFRVPLNFLNATVSHFVEKFVSFLRLFYTRFDYFIYAFAD